MLPSLRNTSERRIFIFESGNLFKMSNRLKFLTSCWLVLFVMFETNAQNTATIREIDTTLTTYPFSDPNPVPRTGKIYPYFTYDQYTTVASPQIWKMVELENNYIRVLVTPEIGGKIWGAWDKTRNQPFIYDNDVVKFRNIAMRGPWTSGGIEFNFGIIGHTPTVSTPVDYAMQTHKDGSVSCYLSALDLLTRTRWIVEVSVPPDKALFSTNVYWVNSSDLEQPYYNWMNLAVPARDDLHFLDPGSHYITHGGETRPWPVDTISQTDLSVYANNDFGGSKSYHITGEHSDFFGTWYEDTNDGMIHLADRDAKPGKKVFLWAQSDAGKIWEDLLTDNAGQYVEVQSGRLLNQNSYSSSRTPFKQLGFSPQSTDSWTEYWFPYHGIGSVDYVDKQSVWHLDKDKLKLGVDIMSLTHISDTMKVWMVDGLVVEKPVDLHPLEPSHLAFVLNPDYIEKITFGSTQIIPEWIASRKLNRPLTIPDKFDQEGAYGAYMLGHDAARFRLYQEAETHIRASLSQDSFFVPALTEMAMLHLRKINYDSAFYFARRALSINTYDPAANYYYGLAASELGQNYDALDGWEIAALSSEWRIPAWYQIAALYFRQQNLEKTYDYLNKILDVHPSHPTAVQMMMVYNRVMENKHDENLFRSVTKVDPDNHISAFERYLYSGDRADKESFQSAIRNELQAESYLEMAIWYAIKLNRTEDAIRLLNMAPRNNLIDYWLAWLSRGDQKESDQLLEIANRGDATSIFPFRRESADVMEWAIQKSDNWKPRYYLALINDHVGEEEIATELLLDLPDDVSFAPLYAWRSGFQKDIVKKEKDLRKALTLNSEEWRYVLNLGNFLMKHDRLDEGQSLLRDYYKAHSDNYQVGMTLARLYLMVQKFEDAEKVLEDIHVLPYEGAREGRVLYQAVKLNLALDYLIRQKFDKAHQYLQESQLWPQNLGVGKPYENLIDQNWENRIDNLIKDGQEGKLVSAEEVIKLRDDITNRFFKFKEEAPF